MEMDFFAWQTLNISLKLQLACASAVSERCSAGVLIKDERENQEPRK
jgi:hypothetical protein